MVYHQHNIVIGEKNKKIKLQLKRQPVKVQENGPRHHQHLRAVPNVLKASWGKQGACTFTPEQNLLM